MLFKDIQPEISATYISKYWNAKVEILGFLPKSRTRVTVKENDRGPGWDEATQSYKGYYAKGGNCVTDLWSRGENHAYGQEYEAHIKQLELLITTNN